MYAHDITHYLPIPAQPVTYRHNVHVQSLRNCLFSSDAAQWWPGVWGWTGPVGHGLDRVGWVLVYLYQGVPLWGSAAGHAQA
jgi:hypothetical protein